MVCGMAETTNGSMGMVKVWLSFALMEPGNIFSVML